jgi:hypothetical protein
MIQFKNIKENALIAYERDEFFEFLTGRNGYELKVMDAPVDVPTDWTRIIPFGIYAIYEETKDENIIYKYQEAIEKAIGHSMKDLWCAANIIYFQRRKEMQNKAPFILDKQCIRELKKQIINRKDEMEKIFPYGKDELNMYQDILRLNSNFLQEWHCRLFE